MGSVANIAGLVEASGDAWSEITRADMRAVIERLPEYADTQDTRWYCSRKFWAGVMLRLIDEVGGLARWRGSRQGARVKALPLVPGGGGTSAAAQERGLQIPCLLRP